MYVLLQTGKHTSPVGSFYATMQLDKQVANQEITKFDTAMYNPGMHYDTSSGLFRCPASGTYVIFATITTGEVASQVSFSLNHNGTRKPVYLCPRNSYGEHFSASASSVVNCNDGEYIGLEMLYDAFGTGVLINTPNIIPIYSHFQKIGTQTTNSNFISKLLQNHHLCCLL